jgi:rhodanese-related sulfurtransferase
MSAPFRTVTPAALKAMLHDGLELALIDVREAGQFGTSHLLFATSVPYSRLEVEIVRLAPRRSVRLVVCDDGDSSLAARAGERLRELGYTEVLLLAGGTRAWGAAGETLFAGVNVPSKLFGELVEHEYHTPRITAQALQKMRDAGEDVVVVDGRPFAEYRKMNIPGAICCPNAELPYRIRDIVKDPATKIVVNCAGRTRSILGAQTLINFGIENPVYALENGTQGWLLADLNLGRGASERYPDVVDTSRLPELQAAARALAARHAVKTVSAETVETWLRDATRTTYLCDVRTAEEYRAGSVAGAVHAPGGQLVQATDQWVGVRNARIVLIDNEGVRAPVVASWLVQMGCEAYVLEEGARATVSPPPVPTPHVPPIKTIAAEELATLLLAHKCTALDLRPSMSFRESHIPGSRWSIRQRVVEDAGAAAHTAVILIADESAIADAAAVDLRQAGIENVRSLEGGFAAWTRLGLPVEATPDMPPNEDCIDYLFFVHDRHAGNREAAQQYLAWEMNLIGQLDEQDRRSFKVGAAA